MVTAKLKEAKFHTAFVISELDKAIELAGENRVLIAKLKNIQNLLKRNN